MKETTLNEILDQNDHLHKKIGKLQELLSLYREALMTYARSSSKHNDINIAEEALHRGKRLEKVLGLSK